MSSVSFLFSLRYELSAHASARRVKLFNPLYGIHVITKNVFAFGWHKHRVSLPGGTAGLSVCAGKDVQPAFMRNRNHPRTKAPDPFRPTRKPGRQHSDRILHRHLPHPHYIALGSATFGRSVHCEQSRHETFRLRSEEYLLELLTDGSCPSK